MVNPLKLALILSRRSSHEYTKLDYNIEYHANASPSAAMTNDLAKTVSFPPVEATATSKLMMNWRGSDLLLNLGRVMACKIVAKVRFEFPHRVGILNL